MLQFTSSVYHLILVRGPQANRTVQDTKDIRGNKIWLLPIQFPDELHQNAASEI